MATLAASLDALDASVLAQLDAALIPPRAHTDEALLSSLLERVERLGALLDAASASEFVGVYAPARGVVKALCRLVMRYAAAVALEPGDAAALLLLDDALCRLLSPVDSFAHQVASSSLEELSAAHELARWVPFASAASCFVSCRQLPVAELTRSVGVADRVLARCGSAMRVADRSRVLSAFVPELSALISQSASKEQWVDPRALPKHALLWVVAQAAAPQLGGDALGRLLALALPLVDDLRDETQLVGARLLRRLVHCGTPTELRWYRDVLLEALRVALTTRKPATLDCLLDCLAETLAKVSPPGETRFYDRFLPRLLTDASLSNDVAVRAVLLRRLRPIVERMGAPLSLQLVRYLQPLLKVLAASFDSINVDLLVEALETLRATVVAAWPRIQSHVEQILVAVLRAVAFCELFGDGAGSFAASPEDKKRLLPRCCDVIALLYEIDSPQVRSMLLTVRDECAGLKRFADDLRGRLEREEAVDKTP